MRAGDYMLAFLCLVILSCMGWRMILAGMVVVVGIGAFIYIDQTIGPFAAAVFGTVGVIAGLVWCCWMDDLA